MKFRNASPKETPSFQTALSRTNCLLFECLTLLLRIFFFLRHFFPIQFKRFTHIFTFLESKTWSNEDNDKWRIIFNTASSSADPRLKGKTLPKWWEKKKINSLNNKMNKEEWKKHTCFRFFHGTAFPCCEYGLSLFYFSFDVKANKWKMFCERLTWESEIYCQQFYSELQLLRIPSFQHLWYFICSVVSNFIFFCKSFVGRFSFHSLNLIRTYVTNGKWWIFPNHSSLFLEMSWQLWMKIAFQSGKASFEDVEMTAFFSLSLSQTKWLWHIVMVILINKLHSDFVKIYRENAEYLKRISLLYWNVHGVISISARTT